MGGDFLFLSLTRVPRDFEICPNTKLFMARGAAKLLGIQLDRMCNWSANNRAERRRAESTGGQDSENWNIVCRQVSWTSTLHPNQTPTQLRR
jgi:hypothetical protein